MPPIHGVYGHPGPFWDAGCRLDDYGVNAVFIHGRSIDRATFDRAKAEGCCVFAEFATLNGKYGDYVQNHPDAHPIQPSFPDTDPVREVPPRRMDKSSFPPNLNGTNHYFPNVSGCAGRSRIRARLRPVGRDTPPRVRATGKGTWKLTDDFNARSIGRKRADR